MAKFLDKFLITTAVGQRHTKDLSCEHITSTDFMRLGTAYYHNMVPKEKVSINLRAFARADSMPVPSFGRANLNIRCFFVPFRTVMRSWNSFITNAIHTYGDGGSSIPTRVRFITNSNLVATITEYCVPGSADSFDIVVKHNGSYNYLKFTSFGRDVYKSLISLGYGFNWNLDGSEPDQRLSALPILALMRVYIDWYWPSAYVGDPDFISIQQIVERDVPNDEISNSELQLMFSWLRRVNYDSDYFVSAFDNPTGPTNGVFTGLNLADPTGGLDGVSQLSNGTPVVTYAQTSNNSLKSFSQYTLDALKRLTVYMRRHQLAGARALDRYLSRFGVTLSAEKLNRSVYLGNHKIPLMTGDVMGTSDTYEFVDGKAKGSPIGAYAGKGFLVGNDGHFEFETDEYGILLILHSLIPEVGYYQGIDRHNMHISRLDFFTPEFDAMSTRAISSAEVLLPDNPIQTDWGNVFQSVFGYTPQYSEYKCGRDWLSGDYRIRTLSVAGETSDAWHLFRDVRGGAVAPLVHSRAFCQGGVDDDQYDRMFYDTRNDVDHFFLHFFFGVTSTAPMRPLYDTCDFEHEDGAKRILDVNGVKMN